jgi:hypothetical protein
MCIKLASGQTIAVDDGADHATITWLCIGYERPGKRCLQQSNEALIGIKSTWGR